MAELKDKIVTLEGLKLVHDSEVASRTTSENTLNAKISANTQSIAQITSGASSANPNAELVDVRVGADGTTYTSAGQSVRGQVNRLKEKLVIQSPTQPNDVFNQVWIDNSETGIVEVPTIDEFNKTANEVTELNEGHNYLEDSVRKFNPNLIRFPYYDSSKTVNGITFTVNEKDGSVTANGTATGQALFNVTSYSKGFKPFDEVTTYNLSGCPSGGSSATYRMRILTGYTSSIGPAFNEYGNGKIIDAESIQDVIDNDYSIRCLIEIYEGFTANNLVFKPMLVKGSEKKEYVPTNSYGIKEFMENIQTIADEAYINAQYAEVMAVMALE